MRDVISNKEIKVNGKNLIPLAEVKEESDITLNLELYKDNVAFDVTGQSIKIGVLIDGKKIGEQSEDIIINKNLVTVKLKNEFIQVGKLELDLCLIDSSGRMTTSSFYLIVNKKTTGGKNITENLLPVLDKVVLHFKIESKRVIDGFIAESAEVISDIKKNGEKTINDIKMNYDSLKQIIIDENQAANLQEQINVNKGRIEQLEDLTPVWQEHSGAGNVTVNDSFDGVTKDLIVKGMTLQNLLSKEKFINTGKLEKTTQSGRECYKILEFSWWNNENNYKIDGVFKENTAYTLIYDFYQEQAENPGIYFRVEYTDGTGESLSAKEYGKWISKTFVTSKSKTIKCIKLTYWLASTVTYFDVNSFRLLEGDYTNKPIPSTYFDSITSSGELEDNKIKIKSVGKNICDKNDFYKQLYEADISSNKHAITRVVEDGRNCFKIMQNGSIKQAYRNRFKPNTAYTISFFCKQKSTNNSTLVIKYTDGSQIVLYAEPSMGVFKKFSVTTSPSKKIDYISAFWSDGKELFIDEDTIQIEENTIATNYEQYIEDSKTIKLPFEGGLKSLPNGVNDEINSNGEIIQRVEKREYREGDELLPNVITDKINTTIELIEPKIYNIHPFFLRGFDRITHIVQENSICGEISFEVAKNKEALINNNIKVITDLSNELTMKSNELNEVNNKIESIEQRQDNNNKIHEEQNSKIKSSEAKQREIERIQNQHSEKLSGIDKINQEQQEQINRKLERVNWGQIEGKPLTFPPTEIQGTPLWEGAMYLSEGQYVTPTKALNDCRNGWVLIFSRYHNDTPLNEFFTYCFVNKHSKAIQSEWGMMMLMTSAHSNITEFNDISNKYVIIKNTGLVGTRTNNQAQNAFFVLRYLYEF